MGQKSGLEIEMSTSRRAAFFFVGADRAGMMEVVRDGVLPDSILRGANFFAEQPGWQVEVVSTHPLEVRMPRMIRKIVPMSLIQLLLMPRLLAFDVVIASDGFLLGYAVAMFGRLPFVQFRPKWIFVAINSSMLIHRHKTHPFRRFLLRQCWNSFSSIVCLSRMQQTDLLNAGVRKDLISIIPFGVDTLYFGGDTKDDGEAIVSIGKDSGRDYPTLFEAASKVDLPITIVASHKNIPHDAHIPSNVTILYDLPLKDLRDMYVRARFAVIVSFSDETTLGSDCSGQTVILETLAMGRAVIATERAWLTEYLKDGRDFLSVPVGNADALAQAMHRLWNDPSLRKNLATQGQRIVREKYSSRRFAENLYQLARRIVEQ